MSLITRCPACGTMFKVVTDQLKVSRGWVRCGHCADVFDASANLQNLASPEAPEFSAPSPQDDPVAETQPAELPAEPSPYIGTRQLADETLPSPSMTLREHEAAWSPGTSFGDRIPPFVPLAAGSPRSRLTTDPDNELSDFDPGGWKHKMNPDSADDDSVLPLQSATTGESARLAADPADEPEEGGQSDEVSFVRDAQRKAFWRKPAVRILLAVFCLVLALLLVLQVAVQQRDSLAALEPRLAPLLQEVCRHLDCELAPLRQIDVLVIDSSSFGKVGADAYRLSFSIKNTGSVAVAMPSLEVTLTDTQERPVVRKIISPAQFGASSSVIAAGADVGGLVAMQLAGTVEASGSESAPGASVAGSPLRVAGYRLVAFYP